ncbi:AAA family ATPase, partial [Streptomyces violaceoruber]
MFSDLPAWRRAAELTGRRVECARLDDLIRDVRAGRSRALAVHGEPGVGKTALLDYVAVRSLGCRVFRAVGVESEMELVYSGLHQLCTPVLDRLDRLPAPQQDALRTAFGLRSGPPPDRFLVGLAVLGLLSEAAGRQPLVCLVDDLQWVDHASAQVLAFVARRLGAESIGLIFAARTGGKDLESIPDIALSGLRETDALALLTTFLGAPIDARVRDQIVFEARGNPLALMQLARGLPPRELAGGYGLPAVVPLPSGVEESFLRQLGALPQPTRTLLLIAAADPSG